MDLHEEREIQIEGPQAWFIVALGILILLIVILAPWQAIQHEWIVQPGQSLIIHWHRCLSGGGAAVVITDWQMIKGIAYDNRLSSQEVVITDCD